MSADETAVLSEPVLAERRGDVLLITLNRPEVRNAVNAALAAGVAGALGELDAGEGLAGGGVTGAGGFFSPGLDLGAFVERESPPFWGRRLDGQRDAASRTPLQA